MKITVNEKIDLKTDRKTDQFLADMKKARTANGWEVIDEGWADEGEVKGLYSVYCSEDTELPDIIPDFQMEAIANILREVVNRDPTVRKYSDYIKADAFFDGGVYVCVSFDPTEELWQEELGDAEYVWKKVASAMASIAERYRSKGAELEKQTQGKGESKESGFLTAWQANAQDAANALEELFADKGLDAHVEFVKDGNDSGTMSAAVVWCGNNRVASFEFEGARRYSIVWYVFGEEIDMKSFH